MTGEDQINPILHKQRQQNSHRNSALPGKSILAKANAVRTRAKHRVMKLHEGKVTRLLGVGQLHFQPPVLF